MTYKIKCNFSDLVLCPDNAVEDRFYSDHNMEGVLFETLDGVICKPKYLFTKNNQDGRYDSDLNDICAERWGIPFSLFKSLWFERLGRVGVYWDLISLTRVD